MNANVWGFDVVLETELTSTDVCTAFTFPDDQATSADRQSDRATDHLRGLIVTLELEPGAVVDEGAISERLGCGRTPLREALHRLAEERLVVILPRRAVAIAQITVTDLQHIYEARITLESAAARLATTRITPSVLSQLERATTSLADGPPEVNPIELVRTDFVFHRILGKASGNAYLYDCIRRILGPAMRLTFLAYKHGQSSRNSYDEHLAIVRALSQRDPDAAEQAARFHIQMAKDRTLGRL